MSKIGAMVVLGVLMGSFNVWAENLFYFDIASNMFVDGKQTDKLLYWSGMCSEYKSKTKRNYSSRSCSFNIITFRCSKVSNSRIEHIGNYDSNKKNNSIKNLFIDFKKKTTRFSFRRSLATLSCYIKKGGDQKQKPALKCTGMNNNGKTIEHRIIGKRDMLDKLCPNIYLEGKD